MKSISQLIRDIIIQIGDDPNRSGLLETPQRVQRAYEELFAGYKTKPREILKIFKDEITNTDGMIFSGPIYFTSFCEHHILPFSGYVYFAYIPKEGDIVGASKIPRLVECFAKRLQVQERLAQQIVDSFMEIVNPQGCIVVIEAEHQCMVCRGIKKPGTKLITSHFKGSFEDYATRMEFFKLLDLNKK